jgi:hypothetical protein
VNNQVKKGTWPIPATAARESDRLLSWASGAWLAAAMLGMTLFAVYIAATYGSAVVRGDIAAWSKTTIKGHVAGDLSGNLVFAGHMVFAVVISVSGVLQLLPALRRRAPHLHRWNGRLFLTSAMVLALGGLHLVWVRDATMALSASLGVSLNAVLILAFGALALRAARAGNYAAHSRWALRTFMVAGGVWFQRLGYMAWMLLNQGPVGMTDNLDGPFDMFLSFGAYLVPLCVAELYIRARDQWTASAKLLVAGVIAVCTMLTLLGIGGATALMWGPRVLQALAA